MTRTRIVPRPEWGATVPTGPKQGVCDELWLHHSVTKVTADPHRDMRVIEAIGKERFGRFSYSYAYHQPTRLWLEGAGRTIGAHTGGRNTRAIGCVVIGNTNDLALGADFDDDLVWLIENRIAAGHLKPAAQANVFPGPWTTPSYPTGGHRNQKQTACPGDHAYARIGAVRTRIAAGPSKPAPPKPTPGDDLVMDAEVKQALAAIQATADKAAKDARGALKWAKAGALFGLTREQQAEVQRNAEKG